MKSDKILIMMALAGSVFLTSYTVSAQHQIDNNYLHSDLRQNEQGVQQNGQSAKKPGIKHWQGMKLEITSTGLVVDGKPGAVTEKNKDATVYQQGLHTFIVYSSGKIAVMDDKGVFQGYAK